MNRKSYCAIWFAVGLRDRQSARAPIQKKKAARRRPSQLRARKLAGSSTLPLIVVLLLVHAFALVILGVLHALLLVGRDVTVGRRVRLVAIGTRLATLERSRFTVGERAVLDAVLATLLLVHITLHVSLHALGGLRVRIAELRIVLLRVDVMARLVLGGLELRLFGRAHLSILEVVRFHLVDARFIALELPGFLGRQFARLQ